MGKEEVFCDVCGFKIIDNAGGLTIDIPTQEKEEKRIANDPGLMLGIKYINNPDNIRVIETFGKDCFKICTTCLLKALGVKPKE